MYLTFSLRFEFIWDTNFPSSLFVLWLCFISIKKRKSKKNEKKRSDINTRKQELSCACVLHLQDHPAT